MARQLWTEQEKELLRGAYPQGIRAIRKVLSGRTDRAIYLQAKKMGLRNDRSRPWTEEDVKKLRFLWGLEAFERIPKALNRTPAAVYHYAKHTLGLKVGCPDGWEHITQAAERTGFGVATLKGVLKHAGVKPMKSYSLSEEGARFRNLIVVPSDVDMAVKEWCTTETLFAASQRLKMSAENLKKQLVEGGLKAPKRKSAVWRIPSKDIERALKKCADLRASKDKGIEMIKVAAIRLGLNRQTFKSMLLVKGVPHGRWGIKTEDVNRLKKELDALRARRASQAAATAARSRAYAARRLQWAEVRKQKAEAKAARQRARDERRRQREAQRAAWQAKVQRWAEEKAAKLAAKAVTSRRPRKMQRSVEMAAE